jgi:hypothetical protein
LDASAWIDAASGAAFLLERTHHPGARIAADSVAADLACGALDQLTFRVNAIAIPTAHQIPEAAKLTTSAGGYTNPAITDLVGAAELSVIHRAVAVVVESVALLVTGGNTRLAHDFPVLALGQSRGTHAEFTAFACLTPS